MHLDRMDLELRLAQLMLLRRAHAVKHLVRLEDLTSLHSPWASASLELLSFVRELSKLVQLLDFGAAAGLLLHVGLHDCWLQNVLRGNVAFCLDVEALTVLVQTALGLAEGAELRRWA